MSKGVGERMAALDTTDRADLAAQLMRDLSNAHISVSTLKAELRAVIDAADTWADANSTAYNSALPQPGRGALSTSDKARILMLVIERRWLRGV